MKRANSLTLALCAGYFLVLLDVTVVNVALPSIGSGLHTLGALAWIVDAYAVPLAALLLAAGAVGDLLGHRRVVIAGFAGFGLASLACAAAPNLGVLVAGRAVQGVCAALMLPGTLALLTESAPDERSRTRLVGVWAAVGGCALPAGPFVGGLLTQDFGWRAVFWLNVPVIAAALVPVVRSRAAAKPGNRRVDWLGAALLVVVVGSLVAAIIEVRESPVAGLVGGILAVLGGFVLVSTDRSLLSVPRDARRPLAVACAVAGVMNLCSIGSLFLITQLFQDVHRFGPLATGLLLLPAMLPLPLLGTAAGRLAHRIGPWRAAAAGLGLSAAGLATMSVTGYPLLLAGFALWGAGLGILTPAIVAAALQAVPAAPGAASGASNTARQVGGALGVALFSAVAGTAGQAGFAVRTNLIFAGCAAVFLITSVLIGRRGGRMSPAAAR